MGMLHLMGLFLELGADARAKDNNVSIFFFYPVLSFMLSVNFFTTI